MNFDTKESSAAYTQSRLLSEHLEQFENTAEYGINLHERVFQLLEAERIEVYAQEIACEHLVDEVGGNIVPRKNTFGVARAERADGREGLVVVTPVGNGRGLKEDAFALSVGLALMKYLSRVPWLAKDIVWLVPATGCDPGEAVRLWLSEYYSTSHHSPQAASVLKKTPSPFARAGFIVAALVVDIQDADFNYLSLSLEGDGGMLPNLDLVNVVRHNAANREQFPLFLEGSRPVNHYSPRTTHSFSTYEQQMDTLARFLLRQAEASASGAHGPFKPYAIEALSIVARKSSDPVFARKQKNLNSIQRFRVLARILEASLRSCSSILEKFHQSFFLYLLVSLEKFVPIEMYAPALGLLLGALSLTAAGISLTGHRPPASVFSRLRELYQTKFRRSKKVEAGGSSTTTAIKAAELHVRHEWLGAFILVVTVHLVSYAFGVALASATSRGWGEEFHWANIRVSIFWLLVWMTGLAVLNKMAWRISFVPLPAGIKRVPSLGGLRDRSPNAEELRLRSESKESIRSGKEVEEKLKIELVERWATVKMILLSGQALGWASLGCFNFALALLGALLVVPSCLASHPGPCSAATSEGTEAATEAANKRKRRHNYFGLAIVLLMSPIGLFAVVYGGMGASMMDVARKLFTGSSGWDSLTWPGVCTFGLYVPCSTVCLIITCFL
ncbi:hypothetical protein CYMTET_48465 [Cymbomonas tetramitiformis]|uniref:Uncharacterized protein n=1 Tax=Cymbomonas tetramitiformis TaxID=36881 RepID=A0AAE0BTV2_9CHLO|nr:hypothetical protein CYMTET_48465 [Cymbomonas tetramitiformis]